MPRPPRLKLRANSFPLPMFGDIEVPEEVKQEMKGKGKYVQFRMPIDVWAKIRTRQISMQQDALQILQKENIMGKNSNLEIPMTEIMRKTFAQPVYVKDYDLVKMLHRKGKGRMFL